MKRLFIILLLLLATPALAMEPIDFSKPLARMGMVMGPGAAASCTASYGSELALNDNATDVGATPETDATTGWTSTGLATFDSVDTGTPYSGSYHLILTADSAGDRVTFALSGLSAGTIYKISFFAKHDGTSSAPWIAVPWTSNGNASTSAIAIPETAITYTEYKQYYLYNAGVNRYMIGENNTANVGTVYVDAFSIAAATLCYGSELYTSANAANIASESDATTGWTAFTGDSAVESVEDGSPPSGSSQLKISTTAAGGGAYADVGDGFSLQVGTKYFISFSAANDGTNLWSCGQGSNATNVVIESATVHIASATHSMFGWDFTYSTAHRYLKCFEVNAGNTGYVYLDKISIKEITGE